MSNSLSKLVPTPDPIDVADVIQRGRARRRRRSGVVGAVVAATVLGVAVTGSLIGSQGQRPDAVPAASTPVASSVICPEPSPPPKGTWTSVSYRAVIIWGGKSFFRGPGEGKPGVQLGAVTCDIVEISDRVGAEVLPPWPDGSSTAADVGTPIHVQEGSDPTCEITMQSRGEWRIFRAEGC